METRVYRAPKKVAVKIVEDEEIKRKADASRYDPEIFGLEGDAVLVVKADKNLFNREIFKDLKKSKDKEKILKKIEEMSQSAASGVGNLFS